MGGTGNQGATRQANPIGTGTGQSRSHNTAGSTLPLATTNSPTQTMSVGQAIERYIQPFLVTMPFLGISVTVHQKLAKPLNDVETALNYKTNLQQHGIISMRGKQGPGAWLHSVGCAIDFNYETSPFLMHEAGESALDATLTPVYERIARFILGRPSVIPVEITMFNGTRSERERLYRALKEESDAMSKYFGLFMREPETFLVPYLASPDGTSRARMVSWGAGTPSGTSPTPTNVLRQIQQDWVTLTGRSDGPRILLHGGSGVSDYLYRDPCEVGMCYPSPNLFSQLPGADSKPDAPYVSKEGVKRDPATGFLGFDYEVVSALMDHGFTWGAIEFGAGGLKVGGSGDVMHFQLTAVGLQVLADAKIAVGAPS